LTDPVLKPCHFCGSHNIPTADVAQVIRCKDCAHRPIVRDRSRTYGFGIGGPGELGFEDTTCPFLCDDGWYNRMPDDDFFCGYGERSTDNG
jgi:DNA-directed RNA polymerase subunit RPC12/RpoP